jgi:hypothetical protein
VRKNRFSVTFSSITSTVLILLLLIAAGSLYSCSSSAAPSEYTIITPSVNPGDTLTGEDFILVAASAKGKYTATIDDEIDTSTPGTYTVHVTVKGNEIEKTYECKYTVRSFVRDVVRLEAGFTNIAVNQFLDERVVSAVGNVTAFIEDVDTLYTLGIGSYRVGVNVNGTPYYTTLIIRDTIPPVAEPSTVYITDKSKKPKPEDFVKNVVDATTVICAFKENYDFDTTSEIPVVIILTDEGGNVTEIESLATCNIDNEPPVISGVKDIEVVVGGTVSYKKGVTVTDNSGEKISLKVDNSRVDLSKVGEYEITYSATDSAGNTTIVRAIVRVVEKPSATEEEMYALAEEVYNSIYDELMTLWELARAIFDWTHDNITYSDSVDTDDWVQAAYDGFMLRNGDCLTYASISQALLNIAGIKNMMIERLRYSNEAMHFWNLVDIGGGYYHFDACWHSRNTPFDSFMRTDAELEAFCQKYDIEYYYRFDHSKYPARSEVSYYN